MSAILIGTIGVLILLILMAAGIHIGVAMCMVGFCGYWYVTGSFNAAFGLLKSVPYTTCASFSMSVVPMFVLMGNFAYYSGISSELYDACYRFTSRHRGGLSIATTIACAGFGAICGSANATTVTMGIVSLPEMKKYNYKPELACGSIAAGGTLGILIPPSTGFILYGINSGISVGKMFLSGILPGIVLTVCYICVIVVLTRLDPQAGPMGQKFTAREKLSSLKGIIPILILFLLVFGGIFLGWFTPNEGGAIGAFGSFLIMILRKKLTFKALMQALGDVIESTAMVMLIMIGAYIFGYFLTVSRLPAELANLAISLDVSRYVVLTIVLLVYAVLGCFVDSLPLIVLLVPIFLPIITALGFDAIWFGVLMVMIMQLGLITPPVGMCCYVMAGITKGIPLSTVFRGTAPFIIGLVTAIIIVIAFPQIATWLPMMMS